MAANFLEANVVIDSGSDVYFGTLHSPEKRRYAELELEDEGDVTLLDPDLRSQSPFKKQCTESITRRQLAVFASSLPVLASPGHQVHESPMAGNATLELIDFNTEAVPASNAYQPPSVSTSLLDASFASSPAQSTSCQDSERLPFENGLLLNANHQSPQAQLLLLDPAQTPTESFLDIFATRSPTKASEEIVLAPDSAACCVLNDGQAEEILQESNGSRSAELGDGSFEHAASATPQSDILPIEEPLLIHQPPVVPNEKASVPKEQKRTLRSRSAIPARAIPANKQLRSGHKVSQTPDGLNNNAESAAGLPSLGPAKTRSTKVPTKARKRLPVPLATLTTTQSQASEAPPETAKPLLSANQLNQLTSRNTTHNKRPYNSHSTVVINKNGCRPPSPSAKIHIAATQKDCTGQQATENAEGKTRTTRSSTDALLDDARDINGTMLVRRSRVKRVQWEKVLEGNEEEGLAKGCRPEASRKGILLRNGALDAAGNALNAKQPLSPIVPREKVVIQRIVYDDDKK